MRIYYFVISIFVWVLLGAGCASLKVDVRAFDPDCFNQVDILRAKALDRAARLRVLDQTHAYDNSRVAILSEVKSALEVLKCKYKLNDVRRRDYCINQEDVDDGTYLGDFTLKVNELISLASDKYSKGVMQTDAGETVPVADVEARKNHYALALDYFYQGDQVMRELYTGVQQELEEGVDGNIEGLKMLDPFLRKVAIATQNLSSGARLFDDQLAAAIVASEKRCWKPEYNDAHALGLVGNTDIAIKMEAAADYSIKGVRLDGAAITRATFGAVRQGIAIAAAAYGVPLPTEQRSTGSNLALSIPELDLAADAQNELVERARLSKMAMWGILEAVSQRRKDFDNTSTRKSAFESLQSIYLVYRPQLVADTNP